MSLFARRECWVPTVRGWVVIAVVLLSCACLGVGSLNDFLSPNRPVRAEVLVVESWIPDYALQGALDEFRRGNYKLLIAPGAGLPGGWRGQSRYKTGADLAAATLVALGLDTNLIAVMPFSNTMRDRTYAAAQGVKTWLESNNAAARAVNLYSVGPHSRRSRLLYQKALGSGVKVGVIAHPDAWYDPKRWWANIEGFREVVGEAMAYLYARLLFPPPRDISAQPQMHSNGHRFHRAKTEVSGQQAGSAQSRTGVSPVFPLPLSTHGYNYDDILLLYIVLPPAKIFSLR